MKLPLYWQKENKADVPHKGKTFLVVSNLWSVGFIDEDYMAVQIYSSYVNKLCVADIILIWVNDVRSMTAQWFLRNSVY